MPLKLVGAVLLTAASFMCGCRFSGRLYKRRNFLRSFIAFLDALATDIRYTSEDIFTVVSRCSGYEKLGMFNVSGSAGLCPFSSAWENCVSEIPRSYALDSSDLSLIREFGSGLGTTDVEGQLSRIRLYRGLISGQLTKSEEAIAQKSKLCKVMGLFCGAAASIMIT